MNIVKKSPTLKGTRVTLRNIIPEIDNKAFFTIFQEPHIHLWTGNNIPENEGETYELLKKYRDLEGLISWAIISNNSNELIGTYWIAPVEVNGNMIITAEDQRIGKSFWRKGYTKEARKLIYDFAFFELGVNEIHAQAWEDNTNSCLSMENAGFTLFKTELKVFPKRNEELTENHYVLTKQDWIKKFI